MRLLLPFFFACTLMALDSEPGRFEATVHYASPTGEASLAQPISITGDDQGRMYILDGVTRSVFVWEKDGSFLRTFSRKGEGPGEIMLDNMLGAVAVNKTHVMVLDSGVKRLVVWDRDFNFVKTVPIVGLDRIVAFYALDDGYIAVSSSTKSGNTRMLRLDGDFKVLKVLNVIEDADFRKNAQDGWEYRPYSDKMTTCFDAHTIFFANSNQNWIKQIDPNGKALGEFKLAIPQEPLEGLDISFYRKEFAKWAGPNDHISFPEFVPGIGDLMAIEGGLLLAVRFQLDSGSLQGLVLDQKTGARKGTFSHSLGNDMGIAASVGGKIVLILANSEGDLEITQNKLVFQEDRKGTL